MEYNARIVRFMVQQHQVPDILTEQMTCGINSNERNRPQRVRIIHTLVYHVVEHITAHRSTQPGSSGGSSVAAAVLLRKSRTASRKCSHHVRIATS